MAELSGIDTECDLPSTSGEFDVAAIWSNENGASAKHYQDQNDFLNFPEMERNASDDGVNTTESAPGSVWDTTSMLQPGSMTPNTSGMNKPPAASDAKDDDMDDVDGELGPLKYHLRPQSRELKSAFMRTWIDRDESGNYGEKDPSEETRKTRRRRSRVKFRLREDFDSKNDETDDAGADDEGPPRATPKLVISLCFQSEDGKAKYNDLVNSLPTKTQAQGEVQFNGYRLRKRGSSLSARYYSECNLDKAQGASDLPDDLTGRPIARGCWECLGLGIRCPLLDDERAWPCTACVDDGVRECDLVTPPTFKRACELCKRTRKSCSYNYTHEHGEACQQCMDDGYRCVAGPAKDTVRVRIRYDRDWEKDPLPKQKPFKVRKGPRSDDSTFKQGILDKFLTDCEEEQIQVEDGVHVPSPRPEQKRRVEEPPQKAQRPSKAQRAAHHGFGTTTTIETKFCHPIEFNHVESGGGEDCHFCNDPSYPILGLEAKKVEVIEWEDGRGLEEISGGHKGDGIENTRVCITCTTNRISIIMCSSHELRPIEGADTDTFDLNDAFAELLAGSKKLKGKWCAICANLARYKCCSQTECGKGCGLLVCEHCMVLLTGMYDGDLQKMLPQLIDEPSEERAFGLRADYEFLKEDGLLMRYILWTSQ